uniref:UvrABC system protein A n=1 Tax=uncultured verrucomicrobium HF0500_27H16 TaxID=723600 RepID=E7C5L7_9BACT|nr:excinuclease ATPase subunit [uncultured verrucomicrobium HF0500_27H16]
MPKPHAIRIQGIRQNNLKGFDLELPLGKLVVVTGVSGAGKSSLVFETLHAEGQRRYVETFSPYTRQFMETLDRPDVESVENIRPSIAITQGNTVKTSRSSVGTMTELCDYFKIWFCHASNLHDPCTGKIIHEESPQTVWKRARTSWPEKSLLIGFHVPVPENLPPEDILNGIRSQGYARILLDGKSIKMDDLEPEQIHTEKRLCILQDRILVHTKNKARFIEAAETAFKFGKQELALLSEDGSLLETFYQGLRSPKTGDTFREASPALFSFNSPLGACPECRGFGRVIETDYRLVIPKPSLSIEEGAIKAFHGKVYSECLRDLLRAAKKYGVRPDIPWEKLEDWEQDFVIQGQKDYVEDAGQWYGIRRFFKWQEGRTYKMHVRVFLSRFRAYVNCPPCSGTRFQPETLNWKWKGKTLPELYKTPISELHQLLQPLKRLNGQDPVNLAARAILTRLDYLKQAGVGYLTLDRTSRTLSGGESQRVNLTACLGTSLTDTLFVLDEPSIGLHSRDIDRLLRILRRLTDAGNTVVIVEHDEAVMRAADHIIELGPKPGAEGGRITFQGSLNKLLASKHSLTGDYLSGRKTIDLLKRRPVSTINSDTAWLRIRGADKNNLNNLDLDIPLNRLVGLSGVSGSGKSTLLNNVIHQGMLLKSGKTALDAAATKDLQADTDLTEIVLVGQDPVSKTPRSNPALYSDTWDVIRELFARTDEAKAEGMSLSSFSFNSGTGRCPQCEGLGYEKIEMQFLSDLYVSCPECEGRRFRPEVLAITYNRKSVGDVLDLTIKEAIKFFRNATAVRNRLQALEDVGLGYLTLGQPLNTLSGGESQRLKLVKYLSKFKESTRGALILLDEPTTGLHRHDIQKLIGVFQALVRKGHSLIVIEHQMDVLKSMDWIIEMGPESGDGGGQIVAEGTPEQLAKSKTVSSPWLKEALGGKTGVVHEKQTVYSRKGKASVDAVRVFGAREHNLQNLNIEIPHRQTTVVTGVSGSGKSTLAFDIVFAEGQRRFLESISSYTRQFVEQLPKPDLDHLEGIAPTIAIQQRVTRGTRKSTVATITEVAHYLRLLYARTGTQFNPRTGNAVSGQSTEILHQKLLDAVRKHRTSKTSHLYLCAPMIRGRKGHHEPLANWARNHGYKILRIDGKLVPLDKFQKLNRYQEHDIELIIEDFGQKGYGLPEGEEEVTLKEAIDFNLRLALKQGKGTALLLHPQRGILEWYSTTRTDPETGKSFPELDPKHFSWNSPKGWCPVCRGFGITDEDYHTGRGDTAHDLPCLACEGSRLNKVSRAVRLPLKKGTITLPELLAQTSNDLLATLESLNLDERGRAIAMDILPQIRERLAFIDEVGLGYLALARSTSTLSGGEAQRIRLASQLGANLSGVLYVLDEPTIGLHPQDNDRLLLTIDLLKNRGNTVLIVEHDETTMRKADHVVDLGPGAGLHGGQLLAQGPLDNLLHNQKSITGRYLQKGIPHPLNGSRRKLPPTWKSAQKQPAWLVLKKAALRNLKGNDLHLPLGRLIAVCGVSGAGKSTLICDLLQPAVHAAIKGKEPALTGKVFLEKTGLTVTDGKKPALQKLHNGNIFKQVIEVDQNPIGKTPRSTPATYLGAFDLIREYFAALPTAKIRGYTASTFSFNTKTGRCETCKGVGRVKLKMNFLPDTYVKCEDCRGRRYGSQLEDIRWKGKSLADVLDMTFEAAATFFAFHVRLQEMLGLMVETGLGYLTLGQSSPTLSGGEAQRLKLATEISKSLQNHKERKRGQVPQHLFLLEEPTIGLHLSDCEKLIHMLHRLVDLGHTVIVIEHNTEILAEADYLVEVGLEGGEHGGIIHYQGTPEGILKIKDSPTAPYLVKKLR